LVDVPVDDFVDLLSQFVRDLRLLRLHQLSHHAHDILAALRSCVCYVQIVQSHVLDDLLLLVHVPFRYRYVLLSFEVELRSVSIRPTDPFARTGVGFDVNHIPDRDAFLLYRFVDGRVES